MIDTTLENAIALAEQVQADAEQGNFNRYSVVTLANVTKDLAREAQRKSQ